MNNRRIVLASGSPRRKELLREIFSEFEVIPSDVEEIVPDNIETDKTAEFLANLKAKHIAKQYTDSLVIGADTIVVCENEIMGKPKDLDDSRRMLRKLSGKPHYVITGVAVYLNGKKYCSFSESTEVFFNEMTDSDIEEYVLSGEPADKAGSYAIQGAGGKFIEKISGDYNNVVGLPVKHLAEIIGTIE